jgi:hypothetical protein
VSVVSALFLVLIVRIQCSEDFARTHSGLWVGDGPSVMSISMLLAVLRQLVWLTVT